MVRLLGFNRCLLLVIKLHMAIIFRINWHQMTNGRSTWQVVKQIFPDFLWLKLRNHLFLFKLDFLMLSIICSLYFIYKSWSFWWKRGEFQPRAEVRLERATTIVCRKTCIYFDFLNMKIFFGVIIVEMSLILFYYELINCVLFMILFCVWSLCIHTRIIMNYIHVY